MKLSGNTVLITGGTSGIGLELAKYLHQAGNTVIICGTSDARIQQVCQSLPGVVGYKCDLSLSSECERLFQVVVNNHPKTNILINNAGIQLRGDLLTDTHEWGSHRQEIAINLEAPMQLCRLFLPVFNGKDSAFINVSSGLSRVPARFAPVYCAAKAGIYAYTRILRKELEGSSTRVVEILPPAVDTPLGGEGVHSGAVNVTVFVTSVMERIANGEDEVGYGSSEIARRATREELDAAFEKLNNY